MSSWSPSVNPLLLSSNKFGQQSVDGAANPYIYFGLIGMNSQIDLAPYGTKEFGYFERVSNKADNGTIFRAVSDIDLANALVRYAPHVNFQLAIASDIGIEGCRSLALRVVNALRIKTRVDMLVPAHISVSWGQLDRALSGSCTGQILEDIPAAISLEEARLVEQSDFDWLWSSGEEFEELLKDSRFNLAVESLCYCHLLRDPRMMAAGLWAGIESLCGVAHELRYRISLIAASILEPRGVRRKALYKRVQALYDVRSKAVHGAELSREKLVEHVVEVRILLAQLVMKCIEASRVFSKEDHEGMLLL